MKNFYRVVACSTLVFLSSSVFAVDPSSFCPPLHLIKSLQFAYAEQHQGKWWLSTKVFDYKRDSWYLIFYSDNLKADSVSMALQKGQHYFVNQTKFREPNEEYGHFCYYSATQGENIMATNIDIDGESLK